MRRALVLLAVVLAGCTNDSDVAERPRRTTSTSAVSLTTTTVTAVSVARPRAPVPIHDQRCSGDPPFKPSYLPAGFGALRPGDIADYERPPGYDDGSELYDPLFHYRGPRGARIDVYHGNSWRLDLFVLVREVQVMGRTGWLSRLAGRSLIDFTVASSPGPCDYWALGAEGVTEAELLRVAASLAAA